MKDDRLYLIHITECIERIMRYTALGGETFFSDTLIQDAVLRNLHTLSESTQRLSDALKAEHPEVNWTSIAAYSLMLRPMRPRSRSTLTTVTSTTSPTLTTSNGLRT